MNYVAGLLRLVSYISIFIAGVSIGLHQKGSESDFLSFVFLMVAAIMGSGASAFGSYYWQHKDKA